MPIPLPAGVRPGRGLPLSIEGMDESRSNRRRQKTKGETTMRLKHFVLGAACREPGRRSRPGFAGWRRTHLVPLFTYRTGPFANSGIPIANGMHDYLDHAQCARRRHRRRQAQVVEECETGYETEKGVECYESLKSKQPAVITPYSTGITLALIPKAAVDKIPILSMAYGLSASAVGNDFPWIFNPPATYWDGLSMIFSYIGGKEGGLDKLKGKTIGYIFFDGGYGHEPIPLLDAVRQGLRLHRQDVPGAAGADAEPVEPLAQRSPRPAGLHDHVGLGRDEPDRGAGSRQDRLSDGSLHRRLVVGQRGRRASGGSRPPRATCRSTSTRWAPTSRRSRTSRST